MENEGNKKAGKVLDMVENSTDKMLSAILIGNNVVNLSASSLATVLATKLLGSSGAGIATGVITLLVLIFGEITLKSFATISADKLALMYYNFIYGLMIVLTPVIFLVGILSRGVLFLLRVDPDAKPETITESELRAMVDVSHEEGVLESDEGKLIANVLELGDAMAEVNMITCVDFT